MLLFSVHISYFNIFVAPHRSTVGIGASQHCARPHHVLPTDLPFFFAARSQEGNHRVKRDGCFSSTGAVLPKFSLKGCANSQGPGSAFKLVPPQPQQWEVSPHC